MAANQRPMHQPRTSLGRYMSDSFIPKYSNNVMGLVYVGAAILIIIVGLRGLGELAGKLPMIPAFLLDNEGVKIDPNWVMIALFLEFGLLLILAIVTFFTPEEVHGSHEAPQGPPPPSKSLALPDFRAEVSKLKDLTDEEKNMVKNYLNDFEAISQKITKIQESNVLALKNMINILSK